MAINKTTQYTTDPNTIPVDTSTGTEQILQDALNARVNKGEAGSNGTSSGNFGNDIAVFSGSTINANAATYGSASKALNSLSSAGIIYG